MSRQTSIYVNGLLAIVLGSLIVSYFAHSGSKAAEIQPVLASERDMSGPIPQKTNKRNWRTVSLQKVFALDQLKDPGDVKVDREGNIYVLDWSDMRIRKFSEKGQLLNVLGKGKGNDPGQFISPTDFALTRDGEVLVADPKRKDITIFNSLGEVVKVISTKTPVMRITTAPEHHFVTMAIPTVEHLFETYTGSGEFLRAFGHLIEEQSYNAVSLTGWIAEDGSDRFVYAGVYAGLLASFKADGEPQFFVQTVDAFPLPKILVSPDGTRKVNHKNAPISAYSLSIAGDEIYMLLENPSNGGNRQIIDVYDKQDGSYLYSSEAPEPCQKLYVTDNYLFTANGSTVTKWRRQI